MLTGCVGVVVFGTHETPDYTYDDLVQLFCSTSFIIFSILTVMWVCFLGFICTAPLSLVSRHHGLAMKQRKLAWGILSGTVAGFLIFLKCSTILVTSGGEVWLQAVPYLVLTAAIVTALAGVLLLHEGLRRYNQIYIVPTYQAALVAMGSTSGAYPLAPPTQMADLILLERCYLLQILELLSFLKCLLPKLFVKLGLSEFEKLQKLFFVVRKSLPPLLLLVLVAHGLIFHGLPRPISDSGFIRKSNFDDLRNAEGLLDFCFHIFTRVLHKDR